MSEKFIDLEPNHWRSDREPPITRHARFGKEPGFFERLFASRLMHALSGLSVLLGTLAGAYFHWEPRNPLAHGAIGFLLFVLLVAIGLLLFAIGRALWALLRLIGKTLLPARFRH